MTSPPHPDEIVCHARYSLQVIPVARALEHLPVKRAETIEQQMAPKIGQSRTKGDTRGKRTQTGKIYAERRVKNQRWNRTNRTNKTTRTTYAETQSDGVKRSKTEHAGTEHGQRTDSRRRGRERRKERRKAHEAESFSTGRPEECRLEEGHLEEGHLEEGRIDPSDKPRRRGGRRRSARRGRGRGGLTELQEAVAQAHEDQEDAPDASPDHDAHRPRQANEVQVQEPEHLPAPPRRGGQGSAGLRRARCRGRR